MTRHGRNVSLATLLIATTSFAILRFWPKTFEATATLAVFTGHHVPDVPSQRLSAWRAGVSKDIDIGRAQYSFQQNADFVARWTAYSCCYLVTTQGVTSSQALSARAKALSEVFEKDRKYTRDHYTQPPCPAYADCVTYGAAEILDFQSTKRVGWLFDIFPSPWSGQSN